MALLNDGKPRFVGAAVDEATPPGPGSAGEFLRKRRKSLGLDLDEAAAALKIKPAYLAALEEGRPDGLPGAVYARGFMRAYAEHLGLDADEVLRRFTQGSTALTVKPSLSFPIPLAERSLPGSGMLLAAAVLAVCGYGGWYYLTAGERSRPERVTEVPAALLPPKPEPAVPHPAEAMAAPPPSAPAAPVLATVDAPVAAPVAAPLAAGQPLQTAALSSAPAAEVGTGAVAGPPQIVIRATADSWVQLRDGSRSVVLARVLKAGETYRVPDGSGLAMRTGNAGGLEITVDGNLAPALGPMGAVRRNVVLDPRALMAGTAVRD